MKKPSPEQIAELQKKLFLPPDIRIRHYLGTGGRAHVFSAQLGMDDVIAKVYHAETVAKYQHRYGVDIAEFEYRRNLKLFELESIQKYIAQPYRVYPASGEYSHCMIQEHISGKTLKDLFVERGYLPQDVIDAGYRIIRAAEAIGVHDLDISSKNVMVIDQAGALIPRLYDFNLMPQHLHAPNPFLWLTIRLGLRGKSHRDYRNLKKWELRGQHQRDS